MKHRLGSRWVVLESGGDKGARRPLQTKNMKQIPCSLANTHISQGFQTTTEDIACGRLTVTLRIITKPIFHLRATLVHSRWGVGVAGGVPPNRWLLY